MNHKIKTVTSRGTIYHVDFPLLPKLHRVSKPSVLIASIGTTVLIYLFMNKMINDSDKLIAVAIYSCLYFFIAGSFAGLKMSSPPHVILTTLMWTLFASATLLYLASLLMVILEPSETFSLAHSFEGAFNPLYILIITVFFIMKIPGIVAHYSWMLR